MASNSPDKLIHNLSRSAGKVQSAGTPEAIHKLRTGLRRLQAVLSMSPDGQNLPPRLDKLRKQAGKVRDLDVQVVALEGLRIGRNSDAKARVLQHLRQQRERRIGRTQRLLAGEKLLKLRKHLKKLRKSADSAQAGKINSDMAMDRANHLWGDARTEFQLNEGRVLQDETLHDLRLACKQVRYTAELAGDHPQAEALIARMKDIQDAIGEWHDWVELTNAARRVLGEGDSPLMLALQNIARAKLAAARRTVASVASTKDEVSEQKRPPQRAGAARTAAAHSA